MDWSVGQFGDARLDNSGAALLEQMAVRKTVCLKRIGGARDGELRAGRFFGHENVTAGKIIDGWGEKTGAAAAGRHVLAIQDTAKVTFKTTEGRRRGLGPVGKGNIYGLLAHVMIAVDADTQALLGLVDGDVWNREGTVDTPHHKRTLENRESSRWLDTAARAKRVLEPAAMVTVVADRESGIYAEWATIPEDRFHVLTRAMVDRTLAGPAGGTLFAAAAAFPLAGTARIEIPARQPDRAKRTSTVEMRFGEMEIVRPHNEKDRTLPGSVRLRLVEVREIVFSGPEIDTIEALVPILEGKTGRQRNPHRPRGLARAAWVMARLGGWNCYYAPPGPITMRRGRERFRAMHEGRILGSIMEQDMRLG